MPPLRFALVLFSIAYAAAQQPAAHVRLGTVGNQTQFHIGQPIPITLDFETDGPQNLLVDTDARLRHLKPQGRDVFSATPGRSARRSPLDYGFRDAGTGLPQCEFGLITPGPH